jgi:hypothetical protein
VAPGIPGSTNGELAGTVVDADTLRRADSARLDGRHYAVTQTAVLTSGNGSLRIQWTRYSAPDGRVRQTFNAIGTGALTPTVRRSDLWTNGSRYWVRSELTGGRVTLGTQPGPPAIHQLSVQRPGALLTRADYQVRERTDTGVRLISGGQVRLPGQMVPVATGPPSNATVRLTVQQDGLVRQSVVSYDARNGAETIRVTIEQRVDNVGVPRVQPPTWLANATSDGERGFV